MFLDKFILKYFIIFDAIVSGIVLFTSFPDVLPLVFRSAVDFCVLMSLSLAVLLSLFISCDSFLV